MVLWSVQSLPNGVHIRVCMPSLSAVGALLRLALVWVVFASVPGKAQSETAGSLNGFVHDASNGEALISATVQLQGTQIGGLSNTSGYYVIPEIPVGDFILVCSYIGYETYFRAVSVAAGGSEKIDINLNVEAVTAAGVVVRADSMRTSQMLFEKPISGIRLSSRQIRAIPQVAEADLLRSLQTLPGIQPLSDFSSALYIRGGTPDQNLYMIDGSDVYNPEHTFGIFSTFNTDAIKQVELSKGGFGAEYGGRLSSVLNVTNLDGNREQFEGTASLSLLSAKTTLQAPLGDRGSLSGSMRRTYFDQTVARFIEDVPDYYFYDGNLKVFLELNDRNSLTISGYGGRDFLDIPFNTESTEETGLVTDWGNKTGSMRWTRVLTPKLFSTFWLTGSRFSSDLTIEAANVVERNFVSDITLKGSVEHHRSRRLITRFGFEQKNLHVNYRQAFPEGLVDLGGRPRQYTIYGQGNWRPNPLWEFVAGLRYNLFDAAKTFQNVAPRLAAKYRLTETINLRAAAGIYYQYLHRVPQFALTDIWTTSNEFQDESRAAHFILGWQQEIKGNFQFEVETFYKSYRNIYQFNQTFLTKLEETGYQEDADPIFTNTKGIFNRGDGHSTGAELLLRKDSGALDGWLAYSYARTKYEFDGINQERSFFPRHDRTSTLNLMANLDLRNSWRKLKGRTKRADVGKWSLSLSVVYASGQPITQPGSAYFVRSSPQDPGVDLERAPTTINNIRLPYYARMDMSLNYRRNFGSWTMTPYLQLFNAGNRSNPWFVDYDFRNNLPDVDTISMLPLLPTIGVNFTF